MRRREAGRGRCLRALSQQGTRAALELPPGPLGVPARSWLTTWVFALPASRLREACFGGRRKVGLLARLGEAEAASLRRSQERDALTGKRGPMPETSATGAPRGARVPQGTSHRFALFDAPPLMLMRGKRHKPDANARRGKEPACLL
jgi:hypothetical protein